MYHNNMMKTNDIFLVFYHLKLETKIECRTAINNRSHHVDRNLPVLLKPLPWASFSSQRQRPIRQVGQRGPAILSASVGALLSKYGRLYHE